jgi:hypothetical protein
MKDFPEAIALLTDKNLIWSQDFEIIREKVASLMAKAWEMEYSGLEPELGELAFYLVRGINARGLDTNEAS